MIIDVPDQVVFDILDVLRLDPIYTLLGSEFEEELLEAGVKPWKWTGYEKEHADRAIACFKVLLSSAQTAQEGSL